MSRHWLGCEMQYRTKKPLEIVSSEKIDNLLIDVIAKSLTGTRKVQKVDKLENPRRQLSDAESIGEFCTWLRREMKPYEKILREFNITRTDMWQAAGIPTYDFRWRFKYETTEGIKQMDVLHAQQICTTAQRKSEDSKTMEEEFRDINLQMSNLFSELVVLQTLNKRAYSINDEADLVLANLCTVAEKLAS